MSESKFKQLQEEVCYVPPEEQEPDKICPTCIPNPNYMPPTWYQTEEPYLNEKVCEYQVKVIININGSIYHDPPTLPSLLEIDESLTEDTQSARIGRDKKSEETVLRELKNSPYGFNTLLKTYIRPGVRKILRHFNKMETDEIVCASPPKGPGDICEGIFGLDYEKHISIQEVTTEDPIPRYVQEYIIAADSLAEEFEQITNNDALELVARVKDYYFVGINKTLVVHIGVPAYRVDAVPNNPDLGSLNTSTDKVVIKPPEFMDTIQRFKSVMNSFKSFQSYFYQQENGKLYFKETGDPFYIKFYAEERIEKFINRLDGLLDKNDFDLRGFNDSGTRSENIAYEIEVSFDKSDESHPFVVSNVRARRKNCPYVQCSVGLDSFIKYSKFDKTMMGYFSDINNMKSQLSTNKTPPWLDFIVSKTFPQLAVNYGSSGKFEDNNCLNDNLQDLSDFILDEAMNLFTNIEYQFNRNLCKTKQEILDQRERTIGDLFSGDQNSDAELEKLKKAWNERKKDFIPPDDTKEMSENTKDKEEMSAKKFIKEFFSYFDPCTLKKKLGITLKCLAAGLSLDEMYYTILKQIIADGGEEALKIVMETLPANKQAEIENKIREQFKDMPAPWEPGWEGGSLGEAVDRQARENLENEDKLSKANNAEQESASLSEQIKTLEGKRDEIINLLNSNDMFDTELNKGFSDILKKIEGYRTQILAFERSKKGSEEASKEWQASIKRIKSEIEKLKNDRDETEFFDNSELRNLQSSLEDFTDLKNKEDTNAINQINLIEVTKSLIKTLEKNIKYDDNGIAIPSESFKQDLEAEIKKINDDIEILKTKRYKQDKTAKELESYKLYSEALTEEDQQVAIEKQKEKIRNVKLKPSDEITQGTLGKALGNVQQALMQAYLDEIMKSATIAELQKAYENIPGSGLLTKLLGSFKCANDPLIYPPIDSFLSTLTFDPCGTESTKIALPRIQQIPTNFNWLELLGDAFYFALKKLVSNVLKALITKTIQLLETEMCRITGNLIARKGDGGLEAVIADVLCPDLDVNRPDDSVEDRRERLNARDAQRKRNQTNDTLLTASGAGGRSQESQSKLVNLLSVAATQREIKEAMVGKGDTNFLKNISTLVKNVAPEYSDVFSDEQSTRQFFGMMGNFLTPDQRQLVIEDLENPIGQFPVEAGICLTREEKDLWDQERIAAFSDPEIGRKFVEKQNENLLNDVSDAVNLYNNGPNEMLENAINDAFNPKDPDCRDRIMPDIPENRKEILSNAITGIFKNLERAFIDDTIEANFFNPFNPPGILIEILSNKKNMNLFFHNLFQNGSFFSFFNIDLGLELPTTVGIQFKKYIEDMETEVKYNDKVSLKYDNQKEDEQILGFNIVRKFTSELEIDEYMDSNKTSIKEKWNNFNYSVSNIDNIPDEYQPNPDTMGSQFKVYSLKKMIEDIWSDFDPNFSLEFFEKFIEGANKDIYNILPKKFLERQEGVSSEGFLYGNADTPILEDSDLVYVNPEPGSTEYTYQEEDKVLGRSLTNNPRVHFLDPRKYGGSFVAPNIYIAEADHKGWMHFTNMVVPNPTGCDPKNSNFLMLDDLMKKIEKLESSIQSHELISEAPDCTVELPFDKISNSNTLAVLEGIVRATVRVHLSDFLIRTFPIFSNVHLDFEKNYNNILTNYITEMIYYGLVNEKSIFASTYEGQVYALLFIEQVVQIVNRKVRNGEMESNEEIETILAECEEVQLEHPKIFERDREALINLSTVRNLLKKDSLSDSERRDLRVAQNIINEFDSEYKEYLTETLNLIESGISIIGSGGTDLLNFLEDVFFNLFGMTLERMRFAAKIASINKVELRAKKLISYIVEEEMQVYTKKMKEELTPRPWIFDINKYFIGGSHILFGKKNNCGIYDLEVPIGGGESLVQFGDINDCANSDRIHPLNGTVLTDEEYERLESNGGFYLEKYVNCKPKNNVGILNTQNISGIISIPELKQFLSTNSGLYEPGSNISDYFGNAVLSEDSNSYNGTIGIKYGVRLCYIPPAGSNFGTQNSTLAKNQRSFFLEPATFNTDSGEKTLHSSRWSFPIASYDLDILDVKMEDLLLSDSNLNQDTKCYIDKLVETKNFKHLFDNILNLKKIPSIYMIFSYVNFLTSLGTENEREKADGENNVSLDDIGKTFNDSKSTARSLFASYYKNNDRDPRNEEESNEDIVKSAQRRLKNSLSFLNLGSFSWDLKRRIRTDSPFDKDGKECKNDFGKFFEVKGG